MAALIFTIFNNPAMNKGLSDNLKAEFPLSVPYPRPLIEKTEIPHPNWIAGFSSGDGHFSVLIRQPSTVVLRFVISQHKRDQQLMTKLIEYFNCGRLVNYKDMVDFWVEKKEDNLTKIIPFFKNNNILGVKAKDFEDWTKIANIINTKGHLLNKKDIDDINQIKRGMNKGRVF